MATRTRVLANFTDPTDGSVCTFEYDYDDVTLRMLTFRCINNCPFPAHGWAARASNLNVNYQGTFPAHQTTTFSVGQGAANRLKMTLTSNGRLDGVEYRLEYPA